MWVTTENENGRMPDVRIQRPGRRVLLCEDDERMRAFLAMVLSDEGYEVVEANHGSEALQALYLGELEPSEFHLVLSDHRMPFMTGMELLHTLRQLKAGPPVILMSAFADDRLEQAARGAGAVDVLAKPFSLGQLLTALRRAENLPTT
jgi:CheY-like chemotaxis protein